MSSGFVKAAVITVSMAFSGALGFKRGADSYQYDLEKSNSRQYSTKQEFFYSESFATGLIGSVMYVCPPLWLFLVPKEIYRLEVNMRGLEEEKKTDRYNRLI